MKRALLYFLAGILLGALIGSLPGGHAQTSRHAVVRCNDRLPLHLGSCGPRVKALQWLLAGHRPNKFTEVKPTFKGKPNGKFGAATQTALRAYRFRIGYPAAGQCPKNPANWQSATVTKFFFNLLEGKATRPTCWVQLVSKRLAAAKAAQPSPLALKVIAYEKHLVALGIHEIPSYSNRGPAISYSAYGVPALQSATGQYGVAWCVSTQQTVLRLLGWGTFAGDTAAVYYALDYYAARNMVYAKPKVGSLIGFVTYGTPGRQRVDSKGRVLGSGHMGFVTAVDVKHRTLTYIAGNDHNAVSQHTIAWGSRPYLFIRLRGLA